MTLPTTSYKILLNNRNTTVSPEIFNGEFTLNPGDLVVSNSSRICRDALLPAMYLGVDPKDSRKKIFLIVPSHGIHVDTLAKKFSVVGTISSRTILLNWEVDDPKVNRIFYKVHQKILQKELHIDLDELILEEVQNENVL